MCFMMYNATSGKVFNFVWNLSSQADIESDQVSCVNNETEINFRVIAQLCTRVLVLDGISP